MKVRRRESGNGSDLYSIGKSSAPAVAVEDLHCIGDIARRVLFLNRCGQGVGEYLRLRLHRAGWLRGSWRRRELPYWIPAFLHLRCKTSADARRAEIAHGLAVGGACGFSPYECDAASLAASTEIGGWLRKFERWRQRGTSLSASGEENAESRYQTEIARQSIHRKKKSIRGLLWALRNPPVLSPSIPATPRGRLCCAHLRRRARLRATLEPCCGRASAGCRDSWRRGA